MASAISPRSPLLNAALTSPLEFLPVTRFPVDDRTDAFQKLAVEKEKEREVIQAQPYRTTPLITPTPKSKPDFVDNKLTGKSLKPTVFRPLDQRTIVGNYGNQAIVHRQGISPRPLYSQQNVAEAVYVQTGYNVGQPPQTQHVAAPQPQYQQQAPPQPRILQPAPQPQVLIQQSPQRQGQYIPQQQNHPNTAPVHMIPDKLPDFNPQKSPTFRAIIEIEGLGTLQPAPNTQKVAPQKPPQTQSRLAHPTAPTAHLNSVGMPNDRIAQSHSFRRLMLSLSE
ncbi:hypothetical protein Ocin01_10776 [Orchesella cincta]|uniref:Zasp-like motif domain-containing protein n=1 Tax=Orchesella cincta TaxID=48709 RepID=A0A1D2MSB8_ORCCI|nr:hypothetical protein Ocin01_10776 [Orchesella cincta]